MPTPRVQLLALPRPTRWRPKCAKSASKKRLRGAGCRPLSFGSTLHAVYDRVEGEICGTMTPSLGYVRVLIQTQLRVNTISATFEAFEGAVPFEGQHLRVAATFEGQRHLRGSDV